MKQEVLDALEALSNILKDFTDNNTNTIPFCAAEPIVSKVVKTPLSSQLSERYIKSGITGFDPSKEFIGSEYLYPIYEQVSKCCLNLFGATYADARPLSGMNAALTSLMSITEPGDRVLLLHPDAGAHESFPLICQRLGLEVTDIPFDYHKVEYDIQSINKLLGTGLYSAIIIPPSDLINAPPIELFNIDDDTTIIYDCTQSFGLIAAGIHPNPLLLKKKVLLLGGTHKTLSGPTCGLLLANDSLLSHKLEGTISPIYVRNPHPHHIASLLLSLIEFIESGKEFMRHVIETANSLGAMLEADGFVLKYVSCEHPRVYSKTHQLFISLDVEQANRIEKKARMLNISLDKKDKKIYGEAGIRLGVQAITRLGWDNSKLAKFSKLMKAINSNVGDDFLWEMANNLRGKSEDILYSFDSNEHEFLNALSEQVPIPK